MGGWLKKWSKKNKEQQTILNENIDCLILIFMASES